MKTKNIFRTLLMAVGLLMGTVSAQAAEEILWVPDSPIENPNEYRIPQGIFNNVSKGGILRVYGTRNGEWTLGIQSPNYENAVYDDVWHNGTSYNVTDNYVEFEITTDDQVNRLQLITHNWDGSETYTGMINARNFTLRKISFFASGESATLYTITYVSQGQTVKTERLEAGATPTPPSDPVRYDGWTFDGWENLPTTMPAHDVTVTAKFLGPIHRVDWVLDDATIRTDDVREGDPIPSAPTVSRYGYIFNGWKLHGGQEPIPSVMPNYDITIKGTTTRNLFTITFVVDGTTVETSELEKGSYITLPTVTVPEGKKVSWDSYNSVVESDATITGSIVDIPKHILTYKVDNQNYKSYEVYEDYPITPEPDPEKAGYTFSGWYYVPSTMPHQDTTIGGHYDKNYMPQSPVWQESSVTYTVPVGTSFTSGQTVDVQTESGVTAATLTFGESGGAEFQAAVESSPIIGFDGFVAYTEGNGTNGNQTGGTFYTITPNYDGFIAIGVVLNKDKAFYILEDGTPLSNYDGITNNAKFKGAYGFSVTAGKTYKIYASGSKLGFYGFKFDYSTPKYTLTYQVDGRDYHIDRLEEGAVPTLPQTPTKTGYSFIGWTGVPETMPAEAVTATAEFSINIYKLTYMVDGQEVGTYEYEYGADITPLVYSVESGKIFTGWNNLPTKMPANDVTVEGRVLKEIQNISISITSSTGYATFSYDEPLDFTNVTALKAYIVKQINQTTATLEQVTGVIAAGTGLIVKGSSTTVPTSNISTGVSPAGNLLVGVTSGSQTIMSADRYVLTEVNGVARFQATEGHEAVIPENHAYLQAPSSNARQLTIVINGATTDLTEPTLEVGKKGVIYDMQGHQVPNPKKGVLYIIEGKKTIFK